MTMPKHWKREAILLALREHFQSIPSAGEYYAKKAAGVKIPAAMTLHNRFGSYAAAFQAAGICSRIRWSDKRIIAQMLKYFSEAPTHSEFWRIRKKLPPGELPAPKTVTRRFGSFEKFYQNHGPRPTGE